MIEKRILELGLKLPEAPKPIASYIPAVRTADLVFVSGQLPMIEGKLGCQGKIGRDCSAEDASRAAEICLMNALAAVKSVVALEQVKRVVHLCGYFNCIDSFTDHSHLLNSASELLERIFGESGKHSRVAVGVASLPKNSPVEISMIVEIQKM
ncbi:MAG: RidA family protein [Candidatus Wallbacteria bacterium]|nr:RidA family protein [Candidatus Wallbacteria bacterium]